MRSLFLGTLLLSACPPPEETGAPLPAGPWLGETSWEIHDTIGSIVQVRWDQDVEATSWVEYRVDADEWRSSPATERGEGEQEQLLLGVPYDHKLQLRVVVERDGVRERGPTLAAHTDLPPSGVLEPVLLAADPERWEPTGNWLLGSLNTSMPGWQTGTYYTFILDRRGRLVWALETADLHMTLQARASVDGASILADDNTWWSTWDFGTPCAVNRYTLDGILQESIEIPNANHPFTELPDGRLAWWGMPGDGEGELRISDGSGGYTTTWSCLTFLEELGLEGSCLANTVSYHPSDQSFLISLALQDLVIHLDGLSGEVVRLYGQHEQAWGFDPPESGFWMQHGVAYTDAGTLLLSTHQAEEDETGVVREYELDHLEGQLRQIWSYGEDQGVQASLGGEAQRLPGGNTLHNYGTTPRVKEITPEGEVVWDADWRVERLLGHTTWLEDLYPLLGD